MRVIRNPFLVPLLLAAACATAPESDGNDLQGAPADEPSPTAETQEPEEGLTTQSAVDQYQAGQQKQRLLAETYVELGNDAMERGDYQGAALHFADAYRLDPANRQAQEGLRNAQAAMEGQPWEWDSAEGVLEQAKLRDAARRMRAQGLVSDGDMAMTQGDFDAAVRHYRAAEEALRYAPNIAHGALELSIVQGKLEQAIAARNDAEAAERRAAQLAAEAEAADRLEAQAEYRENLLARHFEDANQYFLQGFYGEAAQTLDRILELDPRNEQAMELRRIARDARHDKREHQTRVEFRHQWKTTFQDLHHLALPPKKIIEHDTDRWREVVSKRRPLDEKAYVVEEDPVKQQIRAALDETQIEPRFDDSLESIVDNLSAYAKVDFFISRAVRDDVDEDLKQIRLDIANPMPVSVVLDIMEDLMGGEVRFVIRNGAVYVVTSEEADTETYTAQYEVRDIVRPVKDFVLPEYNLSPSGGIDSDDEELPEVEATILTEDELLDTLQETIEPDSWDGDTRSATIENGTLIVHHRREVHQEVSELLEGLRGPANIMVEIKVRFLRVEDSFLQDIGVDFRGLGDDSTQGVPGKGSNLVLDDFGDSGNFGTAGQPGTLGTGQSSGFIYREADDNVNVLARSENLYDAALGDDAILTNSGGLSLQYTWLDDTEIEMILRAVEKSKRSELVIEPRLMVYNTARANLVVANQVSYVSDFDVEIASSAAIADPIVRVANDGIYLDVRPVVTADRRFVWVDIRPTVATLVRPIPTLQTSLGIGSPVTLMLPQLELQKVRTRAFVPDGGSLLLGGMKVIDQQEMNSGIPFLNQVPVLSFFFSRKGTFESYQKLVILLTANIILPEEHEPADLPEGF